MTRTYSDFLASKAINDPMTGIADPGDLPAAMFPFQRDITNWSLRRGRGALFAGTGLGKSLMELAWAQDVVRETKRPILHLAPLAVSGQMVREARKFGIDARNVASPSDCGNGINICNYQKLSHFDISDFGAVVLDECFAPDTPIDVMDQRGNLSKKHIEKIEIGDKIINASGIDRVSDVHRREVPYAVRVKFKGRSIIASPNHPFFTQRGWVGSQDLEPGDTLIAAQSAMRMVRGGFSNPASARTDETVLQHILLSEMADAPTGDCGESAFAGSRGEAWREEKPMVAQRQSKGKGRDRSDHRAKSHVQSRDARKSLPPIESHAAQTFRAWGQWSRDDQAAIAAQGCYVRSLGGGICLVTGSTKSRVSDALQDRLGRLRTQSRYRGGWSLAPQPRRTRSQKGSHAFGYGVDGIEVLELGHPDLDRYRDADGKLYFYDLGGTRHPSFSIHGALVHNSSILKNVDGHYRTALIAACQSLPFRMAATATPAPNDFMELGNHAEFLGVMSYTDMLATFFTHDGGDTQKWRLKGHAENEFWKWMASWAVMLRKPSDLGYSDEGYILPPLHYVQHTVGADYAPNMDTGLLFPMQAATLSERIGARRATVEHRCELAASITPMDRPFCWWTNLNSEAEFLAKAIPGAVNLHGSLPDDTKERIILDFCEGRIERLITKPSIMALGVNAQICADTGFVGLNDSWEQFYQAIRRFWRFGQKNDVTAHLIASELEGATIANLRRKEADADRMAAAMVRHMSDLSSQAVRGAVRDTPDYNPQQTVKIPSFLEQAA